MNLGLRGLGLGVQDLEWWDSWLPGLYDSKDLYGFGFYQFGIECFGGFGVLGFGFWG